MAPRSLQNMQQRSGGERKRRAMTKRLVILAGGISSRMKLSEGELSDIPSDLLQQADERTKGMIGVGADGRPFLDYLLYNARQAGVTDVTFVIGEGDNVLRNYYGPNDRGNWFHGTEISYALQKIPAGRTKPLGTADALMQALLARPDWKGERFVVCNSDNLYSVQALNLLYDSTERAALIDYDRSGLEFEERRISQFGITRRNQDHYIVEIVEKPSAKELQNLRDRDGTIRVSMNIFLLQYDMIMPFLLNCPEHPVRREKELVVAVSAMAKAHPRSVKALPLKEHVPDLTYKHDIVRVREYLKIHYSALRW